jgi:hypothetical protein
MSSLTVNIFMSEKFRMIIDYKSFSLPDTMASKSTYPIKALLESNKMQSRRLYRLDDSSPKRLQKPSHEREALIIESMLVIQEPGQ